MRRILLATTALIVAGVAAPAFAAASAGASDEIIITANKRTEKLSNAPVAASVLSGGALASSNSTDISDINKLVPSVDLNGTFNGRVPMGIRGISSVSNEGTVGLASGVAVIVDGTSIPSDSMAGNALADVARIEVLKGPQSTLGGRTASAGELNIVTYGPTATPTGGLSVTGTTDKEVNLVGHLSGPVTNGVEASLAGWYHHIDYPIKNLLNNQDSTANIWGLRGKILLKPTSNLDIQVAGHYGQTDSHGANIIYTYTTPGANLLCGLMCPPGWPLTQGLLLPGITPSQTNLNYTSNVPNSGETIRDADVGVTIDYHLGDFTLSSITTYQHESQNNVQDLFATAGYFFTILTGGHVPYDDTQTQHETITQTTEEIKIVSPADKAVSFVAGGYFSDSKVEESVVRNLPPAAENLLVTPVTKTYALYGRATWKIMADTSLIGGLRYEKDNLSYTNFQTAYAGPGDCQQCFSAGSGSSDAVVGDITLQHKFDPNSMAYFTYARGYAPQAYNTAAALSFTPEAGQQPPPAIPNRTGPGGLSFTPAVTLVPVGQEHINHFELGWKGSYAEHRLTFDLAAFDTFYDNYQIQIFANVSGELNPPLDLVSTGKAHTYGLELDSTLRPTNLLTIGFNAALINAKFTSYTGAPCWVGQSDAQPTVCTPTGPGGSFVQDASGHTMPNSPKFKFNIDVAQTIPLESLPFDLVVGGQFTYRSSAQMLADQNPQSIQGSVGILNLNLGVVSKDKKYSLTAFVNNVTDKVYYVDMEDFWASPWASNTVVSQPARDAHRYAGLRLDAKF